MGFIYKVVILQTYQSAAHKISILLDTFIEQLQKIGLHHGCHTIEECFHPNFFVGFGDHVSFSCLRIANSVPQLTINLDRHTQKL